MHTQSITCWSVSSLKGNWVTVSKGCNHFFSFSPCCSLQWWRRVMLHWQHHPHVSPPRHVIVGALPCLGSNWWERCPELGLQCCTVNLWIKTSFSLPLPSPSLLCWVNINFHTSLSNIFSFQVHIHMHVCIHMHARWDKINAYALWLRSFLAAIRGSHAK